MMVFYMISTGACLLAIVCDPEEITIENNKAYFNGAVVNNNMTLCAMAEYPVQSITGKIIGQLTQYTTAQKWARVREKRNAYLLDSDLCAIDDCKMTGTAKQAWKDYRQLLRDIPQTYAANPDTVVWPAKPAYVKA